MTPVYVPSKGRAGHSATLTALIQEGHSDVTVVVPSGERASYTAVHDVRVIQQTSMGIGDARQTALTDARKREVETFWILDDDIRGCYRRRVGATSFYRCDFRTLMDGIEAWIKEWAPVQSEPALKMAGPQFRHRAWAGPGWEWDKHLRNFVLIRTDVEAAYWPWVKEDLDFVLQVLGAGYRTLRFNEWAFDSPAMGSTEGGCFDDYARGALEDASRRLVDRWPGVVSMRLNERTGYIENVVDWKAVLAGNIRPS